MAFLSLGPRYLNGGLAAHNSAEIFAYILRGVGNARMYLRRRANFIRVVHTRVRTYTRNFFSACTGLASTRIRGDVQCMRLRLTLARRLKCGRWWRKEGWGGGGPREEGPPGWRRSVCSRAMNYAVRRGLGPRTPASGRKTEKELPRGESTRRETGRETTIYQHGPEPLCPPHPPLASRSTSRLRLHLCAST